MDDVPAKKWRKIASPSKGRTKGDDDDDDEDEDVPITKKPDLLLATKLIRGCLIDILSLTHSQIM